MRRAIIAAIVLAVCLGILICIGSNKWFEKPLTVEEKMAAELDQLDWYSYIEMKDGKIRAVGHQLEGPLIGVRYYPGDDLRYFNSSDLSPDVKRVITDKDEKTEAHFKFMGIFWEKLEGDEQMVEKAKEAMP